MRARGEILSCRQASRETKSGENRARQVWHEIGHCAGGIGPR